MDDMYQLLDDWNLARYRLDECGDESIVGKLNREAYDRAKNSVEQKGRQYFGDDSLSCDDIKNMVISRLVDKAKAFLSQDVDSMIGTIDSLDEDTGAALICIENILNMKNDSRSGFDYSNMFRIDREYFSKFSEGEIAKFQALSSVLVGTSDSLDTKAASK